MAYILYNPTLLASLRHEIDPVVSEGINSVEYRLEQYCPLLKAVNDEVMRLATSSITMRTVLHPTEIGDKILQRGATLLIPYRQLHRNEDIFGEGVEDFHPERFLGNDLNKHPCFRPFGGGRNHCTGRVLAQREILTFVALALHRFDIDVAEKQQKLSTEAENSKPPFPRMDEKKFCAFMEPVKGDDVMLKMRKREL